MVTRIKALFAVALVVGLLLLPQAITHADPIGCGAGCAHSGPTPTPTRTSN